ncbi:hypothetical protein ACFSYH_02615 [Populibacterium corticicola]|uniref:Uncharacterized protein n=1 Tax=Populibacterium corticicola TaxID=1812826 RepID=A0ABW5XDI1_9MICO
MKNWSPKRMLRFGIAGIIVGLAMFLLGVFQPWVTCPDEPLPVGCPAPTESAVLMIVGFLIAAPSFFAAAIIALRKPHNSE